MSFLDINDKNNKLKMFIKKYLNIASSSFVKSKNKNKNDNIVLTGNNFLGGNIIDELFPVDINEYTHENITSEIRNQIMNLDINNINIDNTYLNVKKYINTIDFPFLIKYERMMLTQILQSTQGTVTYQIYNIGVNNDNFLDRHTLPVNYLQQNNNYNPYRCILERINNNGEFVEYNYGTEWFFDNKLGYIFLFNEGTTIPTFQMYFTFYEYIGKNLNEKVLLDEYEDLTINDEIYFTRKLLSVGTSTRDDKRKDYQLDVSGNIRLSEEVLHPKYRFTKARQDNFNMRIDPNQTYYFTDIVAGKNTTYVLDNNGDVYFSGNVSRGRSGINGIDTRYDIYKDYTLNWFLDNRNFNIDSEIDKNKRFNVQMTVDQHLRELTKLFEYRKGQWSYNDMILYGDGNKNNKNLNVGISKIFTNDSHVLMIDNDANIYSMGYDYKGSLGRYSVSAFGMQSFIKKYDYGNYFQIKPQSIFYESNDKSYENKDDINIYLPKYCYFKFYVDRDMSFNYELVQKIDNLLYEKIYMSDEAYQSNMRIGVKINEIRLTKAKDKLHVNAGSSIEYYIDNRNFITSNQISWTLKIENFYKEEQNNCKNINDIVEIKENIYHTHDTFYDNINDGPISNYRKEKLIVTPHLDELVLETTYNENNRVNTVLYNTVRFVDTNNVDGYKWIKITIGFQTEAYWDRINIMSLTTNNYYAIGDTHLKLSERTGYTRIDNTNYNRYVTKFLKIKHNDILQFDYIRDYYDIRTVKNLNISDKVVFKIQNVPHNDFIEYDVINNFQNLRLSKYVTIIDNTKVSETEDEEFKLENVTFNTIVDNDVPTIINDISMNNKTAACGKNHSVVVKNDGTIYAFGDNEYGQFGKVKNEKVNASANVLELIDFRYKYRPELIETFVVESNIVDIVFGKNHTIYITKNYLSDISDSTILMSCGKNDFGQCGLEHNYHVEKLNVIYNINDNIIKTEFDSHYIIKVAAGDNHTLFLDNTGFVYSCGDNKYGQCGQPLGILSLNKPTLIDRIQDVKDIQCGANHSIVLHNNGKITLFGDNTYGQCGYKQVVEYNKEYSSIFRYENENVFEMNIKDRLLYKFVENYIYQLEYTLFDEIDTYINFHPNSYNINSLKITNNKKGRNKLIINKLNKTITVNNRTYDLTNIYNNPLNYNKDSFDFESYKKTKFNIFEEIIDFNIRLKIKGLRFKINELEQTEMGPFGIETYYLNDIGTEYIKLDSVFSVNIIPETKPSWNDFQEFVNSLFVDFNDRNIKIPNLISVESESNDINNIDTIKTYNLINVSGGVDNIIQYVIIDMYPYNSYIKESNKIYDSCYNNIISNIKNEIDNIVTTFEENKQLGNTDEYNPSMLNLKERINNTRNNFNILINTDKTIVANGNHYIFENAYNQPDFPWEIFYKRIKPSWSYFVKYMSVQQFVDYYSETNYLRLHKNYDWSYLNIPVKMAENTDIDELTQDDGYLKKSLGGHYQLRQEVYDLLRFPWYRFYHDIENIISEVNEQPEEKPSWEEFKQYLLDNFNDLEI